MYGGFRDSLDLQGAELILVGESCCRVVEVSKERQEVDVHCSRLVPQKPRSTGIEIIRKDDGVPDVSRGE